MDGAATARKIVRDYERGWYSPLEVEARLIMAGEEYPPADLATALPTD